MTCSIRPLAKEDLDQVNAIDHEAFPTQWPPPNYRQELQNKIAHYLVATDDSRMIDPPPQKPRNTLLKLIGRLMPWSQLNATPRAPSPRPYIVGFSGIWMMADEAHITNIAVRQPYQGKGIGGMLLIATIDMAWELKASLLTLEVRASNLTAQQLYSRYGFKQTGLRRGYYLDNREDAVIMSTESISSPEFRELVRDLRATLAAKLNQA
ncbi:MAG: ribosomal protein S18-alanine N-acetyltransferase [Dehalococcoidales bacterium]